MIRLHCSDLKLDSLMMWYSCWSQAWNSFDCLPHPCFKTLQTFPLFSYWTVFRKSYTINESLFREFPVVLIPAQIMVSLFTCSPMYKTQTRHGIFFASNLASGVKLQKSSDLKEMFLPCFGRTVSKLWVDTSTILQSSDAADCESKDYDERLLKIRTEMDQINLL